MDGFPVTFLEAAACKRPVITVALPAYLGTFAENAFRLVLPNDVAGLAAAIAAHADGAASARQLDEVRGLVEREYDESVSASRLLAHYEELARHGRVTRRAARPAHEGAGSPAR
jgi:glycosyltransferase involved in cell wall biosynthesis